MFYTYLDCALDLNYYQKVWYAFGPPHIIFAAATISSLLMLLCANRQQSLKRKTCLIYHPWRIFCKCGAKDNALLSIEFAEKLRNFALTCCYVGK